MCKGSHKYTLSVYGNCVAPIEFVYATWQEALGHFTLLRKKGQQKPLTHVTLNRSYRIDTYARAKIQRECNERAY